jgi:hypothetical protein
MPGHWIKSPRLDNKCFFLIFGDFIALILDTMASTDRYVRQFASADAARATWEAVYRDTVVDGSVIDEHTRRARQRTLGPYHFFTRSEYAPVILWAQNQIRTESERRSKETVQ